MINKPFLSTSEIAKISGKSRVAIFKQIKAGRLKAKKVGRNYLVPAGEARKIVAGKLSAGKNSAINRAVDLAVKEYGETFRLLGRE